jgi:hypothetical protein
MASSVMASSITKIHPEILFAIVPVFFLVAIVPYDYWTQDSLFGLLWCGFRPIP